MFVRNGTLPRYLTTRAGQIADLRHTVERHDENASAAARLMSARCLDGVRRFLLGRSAGGHSFSIRSSIAITTLFHLAVRPIATREVDLQQLMDAVYKLVHYVVAIATPPRHVASSRSSSAEIAANYCYLMGQNKEVPSGSGQLYERSIYSCLRLYMYVVFNQ